MKDSHLLPLLTIAKKGKVKGSVFISSKDLGKELGVSQQTASRWLNELESSGAIERIFVKGGQTITLTETGKNYLKTFFIDLCELFNKKNDELTIEGTIESGIGEGKYYVSRPFYIKQFQDGLGFEPYPGTLNIRLPDETDIKLRKFLDRYPSLIVQSGVAEGRSFGHVRCYKALIDGKVEGAVIIPLRTHHPPNVVEIISPKNLKNALKKKDGELVTITVEV
jgi:riboflavin kinase